MKKLISLLLTLIMIFSFCGCADDSFGHETYTNIKDYNKIFELTEIRYNDAFELFPQETDNLNIADFYCEWELAFVGSAKTEIILSVKYSSKDFNAEINRLKSINNNTMVYDTETFKYPAYSSVLGYMNTNYYALIDEENSSVHYILLQLIHSEDIDINNEFLPKDYQDAGEIDGISYNIYEK